MDCGALTFSKHALVRMFERGISASDVERVVATGTVIEEYPSETGLPACLIPGEASGGPLHAVIAYDDDASICVTVTVYRPAASLWSPDFRSSRQP